MEFVVYECVLFSPFPVFERYIYFWNPSFIESRVAFVIHSMCRPVLQNNSFSVHFYLETLVPASTVLYPICSLPNTSPEHHRWPLTFFVVLTSLWSVALGLG